MNAISKEILTSYALDELSKSERQQLETLLANSPEDQLYADDTRRFCELLQQSIGGNDGAGLTEQQRAAITQALPAVVAKRRRWPLYALVTGAAAAAIVWTVSTQPSATSPSVAAGATADKISPQMPPPLFAGTPIPADNSIPNLDKSQKPIVSAVVPAGTKLISHRAPVTSSTKDPFVGTLDLVTDGEKDGSDGYCVELDPGKQWLQVDLGREHEVWAVWLWHYHKQGAVYKGVVVQISNDPEFKNATIIYNNDYDNSIGLGIGKDLSYVETNNGRYMDAKGVRGRYVRFWSNGRYIDEINHYIEAEVYGK